MNKLYVPLVKPLEEVKDDARRFKHYYFPPQDLCQPCICSSDLAVKYDDILQLLKQCDCALGEFNEYVEEARNEPKNKWNKVQKLEEDLDNSVAVNTTLNKNFKMLLEGEESNINTKYVTLKERHDIVLKEIKEMENKLENMIISISTENKQISLDCEDKIRKQEEIGKNKIENIKEQIEKRKAEHIKKVEELNLKLDVAEAATDLEQDEIETKLRRELIDLNNKIWQQQNINTDLRIQIDRLRKQQEIVANPRQNQTNQRDLDLNFFNLERLEEIFQDGLTENNNTSYAPVENHQSNNHNQIQKEKNSYNSVNTNTVFSNNINKNQHNQTGYQENTVNYQGLQISRSNKAIINSNKTNKRSVYPPLLITNNKLVPPTAQSSLTRSVLDKRGNATINLTDSNQTYYHEDQRLHEDNANSKNKVLQNINNEMGTRNHYSQSDTAETNLSKYSCIKAKADMVNKNIQEAIYIKSETKNPVDILHNYKNLNAQEINQINENSKNQSSENNIIFCQNKLNNITVISHNGNTNSSKILPAIQYRCDDEVIEISNLDNKREQRNILLKERNKATSEKQIFSQINNNDNIESVSQDNNESSKKATKRIVNDRSILKVHAGTIFEYIKPQERPQFPKISMQNHFQRNGDKNNPATYGHKTITDVRKKGQPNTNFNIITKHENTIKKNQNNTNEKQINTIKSKNPSKRRKLFNADDLDYLNTIKMDSDGSD